MHGGPVVSAQDLQGKETFSPGFRGSDYFSSVASILFSFRLLHLQKRRTKISGLLKKEGMKCCWAGNDKNIRVKGNSVVMAINSYQTLHYEFVKAGANVLLSSGQACVMYGIAAFSKGGERMAGRSETKFQRGRSIAGRRE